MRGLVEREVTVPEPDDDNLPALLRQQPRALPLARHLRGLAYPVRGAAGGSRGLRAGARRCRRGARRAA